MKVSKRLFDIIFSFLLIVIFSPILLATYFTLLVINGRPVIFRSERMKTTQCAFEMLKFRTMTYSAQDKGVSAGYKDNRILPLGQFLRKYRIDELPQLFNILRGDMSFVGPRPPLRCYVEMFPELYTAVLASCPGVTGLATIRFNQIETRLLSRCSTAVDAEKLYIQACIPPKAMFDLIWARNQCFIYDLRLIIMTVKQTLAQR